MTRVLKRDQNHNMKRSLYYHIAEEFYGSKLCAHQTMIYEPVHEISKIVVCATSKASDQPAHMRSLIRAFACRLNIL